MKLSLSWPSLLLAAVVSSSAQVVVEVSLEQQQFLPGEELTAAVRVINRSGQALHLGAQPDWLSFSIESREGSAVPQIGEVPTLGEFDLESSQAATKRVDLAPYFAFSHEGRYAITATIRIKNWERDINSRPSPFDIIEGAKLWEQEVGIPPGPNSTNLPPQVRTYILQQANYLRGHLRLYLRVLDSYGKPIKVVAVGPMISFGRPDPPQIDKDSNLHVLYQNGPASFLYSVFNPSGELVVRQVHDYANSRPRLRMDDAGQIAVTGGARRLTSNDVPPSSPDEDDDHATKAPTLPSTENPAKDKTPTDATKGPKP